jgi:hypothetical protein
MSNGIDRIIATGYPQGTGGNQRFSFTCLSCGQQVTTQREYSTGQSGIAGTVLTSTAQSSLSSLLCRIPVVGSILSSMISSAVGQRQSQGMLSNQDEAKRQAFEEVRGHFVQCARCGNWACVTCLQNGLCRSCAMMSQPSRDMSMQDVSGQNKEGASQDKSDPTQMWDEKK